MNNGNNDRPGLLLVDDEDGFRTTIAKRLGKRGFVPIQASSGEECLDILGRKPVGVVVLDVKMPGISGIDTLKAIKQAYKKIQVILLTGNITVSDGIEGIKAGAFDYLTKPVELDHLVNKIKQAFEMIRLEEEKQKELEYRAKLEKKMIDTERLVSLGTMSTGIAHEINNPLAIINESAGFMKQVIIQPEMSRIPQKEALLLGIEKIEKSIKRARKITHQLLGHVKKQKSQISEVDLKALLGETLGLLEREVEEKNIQIKWKTDKKKKVLWSDPYQIRQILINLLSNAVHAVKNNGIITLSLWETDVDINLEIKDNGIGIPKKNLGKIFDPFFTTKPFDEGTGLGLFVVHKIISSLSGEVTVESTLGKGSSFMINLPKRLE
ncbi:hybrid sensor histidine kinase/response regulator [Desulfobacula toluolica]|uniref:hybrid sensor histidine kinase/response regulator n=1 Tax=Desulfobacula toluolica TaxID=28223 RepID=UPI00031BDFF0|nr:response regulator [Desulfobacula toluolica]